MDLTYEQRYSRETRDQLRVARAQAAGVVAGDTASMDVVELAERERERAREREREREIEELVCNLQLCEEELEQMRQREKEFECQQEQLQENMSAARAEDAVRIQAHEAEIRRLGADLEVILLYCVHICFTRL